MELYIGMKRNKLVELHEAIGKALKENPEDTPHGSISVELYGPEGGYDFVTTLNISTDDMGTDRTDLSDDTILADKG